jgi:DNA-binding MarR family transcriptional regulator
MPDREKNGSAEDPPVTARTDASGTRGGDAEADFVLVREVPPPHRIALAKERLLMSQLYVDLIAGINDDYGAEFACHSDSCTLRSVGIYVFYRTLSGDPAHVAQIGQALGLPKTVVNHRLDDLIGLGYVERVGNAYRITDRVNVADLEERLRRRVDLIVEAAAGLMRLRAKTATVTEIPTSTPS